MARPRSIPDADVFRAVLTLLGQGGERAVSFSSVAQACGLSAPSLVQRYASREGMLRAALLAAWDKLEAATTAAEQTAPLSPKGAAALLKTLNPPDAASDLAVLTADIHDASLRQRAAEWRDRLELALALRLGGGARDREGAAMLFAAWQGRMLWAGTGGDGEGFRLRDSVRRIAARA